MGLTFLDGTTGSHTKEYCCRTCYTPILDEETVESTAYNGFHGDGLLCTKVSNVYYKKTKAILVEMKTGDYYIEDVFCKRCDLYLGWHYTFAFNAREAYKEDMYVMECAQMMLRKKWCDCKGEQIKVITMEWNTKWKRGNPAYPHAHTLQMLKDAENSSAN